MCNTNNSSLSVTTIQLSEDEIQVVFGADTKAILSLCDYKEVVSVYEYSEITLPANSNREIAVDLDWKVIALRFIYDPTIDISLQHIGIKENDWLVNPITEELYPNFELDETPFMLFLPYSMIDMQDVGEVGDIVSIANVQLVAGTDFAIGSTIADTATNIMTAITNNTTLLPHVTTTYFPPNLTIRGTKPLKSYQTIQIGYTPINTSTNSVVGDGFLKNDFAINDSLEFAHELLVKSVPLNNLINLYTLYNFMETDVTVKILKVK